MTLMQLLAMCPVLVALLYIGARWACYRYEKQIAAAGAVLAAMLFVR
jgi:hypothetical protein